MAALRNFLIIGNGKAKYLQPYNFVSSYLYLTAFRATHSFTSEPCVVNCNNMSEVTVRRGLSCAIRLRLAFSSLGVLVGFSVFPVFFFHYENSNAGLWGLISGICAAIALGVTIAHIKKVWDPNPLKLKRFMLAGCFIQLAGICGFVAYLVLGITQNKGLVIYGPGYYLACVWCFITWKWGLGLLLYSRAFLHELIDEDGGIVQAEEAYGRKASYGSVDNH